MYFITTVLLIVTIEKKPLIISNFIKKKSTSELLLKYINKSSATNCDEATIQDSLHSLYINLIDENLKLLCENSKLVADEKRKENTIKL